MIRPLDDEMICLGCGKTMTLVGPPSGPLNLLGVGDVEVWRCDSCGQDDPVEDEGLEDVRDQ